MPKTSRRRGLALVLLLAAAGVAWFAWSYWADGGIVPGAYTADEGAATVVTRFGPDGAWVQERFPAGATVPAAVASGRWRVAGRVLVLETGAAAAAPVGALDRFAERFREPLLGSEVTRLRVVSADADRVLLDYGNDVYTGQPLIVTFVRRPAGM